MKSAQPSSTSCDFCAIARGEDATAEIVAEGDSWVAFFPLNPATPGHTLVIPRRHLRDLWQSTPPLSGDLMDAVVTVGRAVQDALNPDGMNLISSAGKTAEQTVFHLHLHLVPRWERDGFGQIWPLDGQYEDDGLKEVANRIRKAWNQLAG